ncbi:MAG: hypothetical protein H6741_07650 [Alphaproteobacteria bacterium]|nr:hypothetical protein [Alphaproteobacteria bacterium]MCB9792590.1 hypothetical protein [Alphaproteobacteria bacterium]
MWGASTWWERGWRTGSLKIRTVGPGGTFNCADWAARTLLTLRESDALGLWCVALAFALTAAALHLLRGPSTQGGLRPATRLSLGFMALALGLAGLAWLEGRPYAFMHDTSPESLEPLARALRLRALARLLAVGGLVAWALLLGASLRGHLAELSRPAWAPRALLLLLGLTLLSRGLGLRMETRPRSCAPDRAGAELAALALPLPHVPWARFQGPATEVEGIVWDPWHLEDGAWRGGHYNHGVAAAASLPAAELLRLEPGPWFLNFTWGEAGPREPLALLGVRTRTLRLRRGFIRVEHATPDAGVYTWSGEAPEALEALFRGSALDELRFTEMQGLDVQGLIDRCLAARVGRGSLGRPQSHLQCRLVAPGDPSADDQ